MIIIKRLEFKSVEMFMSKIFFRQKKYLIVSVRYDSQGT